MWTETTRIQYRREELRYASDTRTAEWQQIAPLLPPPQRHVGALHAERIGLVHEPPGQDALHGNVSLIIGAPLCVLRDAGYAGSSESDSK